MIHLIVILDGRFFAQASILFRESFYPNNPTLSISCNSLPNPNTATLVAVKAREPNHIPQLWNVCMKFPCETLFSHLSNEESLRLPQRRVIGERF